MKNDKVIVVNGFNRGGTSIVWNMLQSQPQVCSPIYETGQVLRCRGASSAVMALNSRLLRSKLFTDSFALRDLCGWLIDRRFFNMKLRNLDHQANVEEFKGVVYSEQKVRDSALCLKSSTTDMDFTDLLARIYDNIFFIGLIRNGYGVCAAWMRWKPVTARKIGRLYRRYGEMMIEDSERMERYKIVKFEDVVADPFRMASELFVFAQLEPPSLDKLRLKAKKFLPSGDELGTSFGVVHEKYWFDRDGIGNFLVPNASDIQAKELSPENRKAFEAEAWPVLEHFGYAKAGEPNA